MQITVTRPIASQIDVNNVITRVVQSGVGLQGPAGSGQNSTSFEFDNSTPITLQTVLADQVVFSVELFIIEAFNGTGAAISVGDTGDHERLLAEDVNLPGEVGSYLSTPGHEYATDTPIKLWITPGSGATQGRAVIVLNIET